MLIKTRKAWELPGLRATQEEVYTDRRRFLRAAGFGSLSLFGLASVHADEEKKPGEKKTEEKKPAKLYPAQLNPKYKKLDRELTNEALTAGYNNFYEFSYSKVGVRRAAQAMVTSPWKLEISGLVEKPIVLDIDELIRKLPLEERLYRFRCVEAWAMAVPWTGIPLKKVIELAKPLRSAKFVRFVTFHEPKWGPNFRDLEYPWPYQEALTLPEATNELAMLVTGIYGKPLPKQNGAPARVIVPWKYGYKGAKSIVKIELTSQQPKTFWNESIPQEYGLVANVEPKVSHPRWSQSHEQLLGEWGTFRPTLLYNGYEKQVAHLYKRSS